MKKVSRYDVHVCGQKSPNRVEYSNVAHYYSKTPKKEGKILSICVICCSHDGVCIVLFLTVIVTSEVRC